MPSRQARSRDRIDAFRGFLADRLMEESALAAEQDAVEIDALITPKAADRALYEDFQRLTPFGIRKFGVPHQRAVTEHPQVAPVRHLDLREKDGAPGRTEDHCRLDTGGGKVGIGWLFGKGGGIVFDRAAFEIFGRHDPQMVSPQR